MSTYRHCRSQPCHLLRFVASSSYGVRLSGSVCRWLAVRRMD
jgi:hypothetical protein